MKRILILFLIFVIAISLFACRSNETGGEQPKDVPDEAGITGYVMNKENGRILVVSSEAQDFSSTGGVDEFYNAIWFSKAPEDVNIGDKVKVWFEVVAESYPGQSEVKRLEKVSTEKPKNANLTEGEALYRALKSEAVEVNQVLAVKSLEFDNQSDCWNIKLIDTFSHKILDIKIQDK